MSAVRYEVRSPNVFIVNYVFGTYDYVCIYESYVNLMVFVSVFAEYTLSESES